jgi:hypothetical protein
VAFTQTLELQHVLRPTAVAIGLEQGAFPLSSQGAKLKDPYPPSVLIHFTADKSTDAVSC